MGCDIHMYPEVKRDGKWEFAYKKDPDGDVWPDETYVDCTNYYAWSSRYYWLFGVLAGVRSYDATPISDPKGLPDDMSAGAKQYYHDGDRHSDSWLTLKELLDYKWDFTDEDEDSIRQWLGRLAELDPNPENVRIVFGFDS